jgi:hypothetical protein
MRVPSACAIARIAPSHAKAPSARITRAGNTASSRARYGTQLSRSSGVGLLPGGAHRLTAATYAPSSRSPSPGAIDVGWFASPHRYSDAYRKSPLRSPVKMRPVRLPPCAAGASPTINSRAVASPNPGSGRPQYVSSANRATFSCATCSRHATRRGHFLQTTTSASMVASVSGMARG